MAVDDCRESGADGYGATPVGLLNGAVNDALRQALEHCGRAEAERCLAAVRAVTMAVMHACKQTDNGYYVNMKAA